MALLRLGAIVAGGGVALALTFAVLAPRIGDIIDANSSTSTEVNLDELALRTIVFDRNGDEFDVLYDVENRALVEVKEISREAIIAITAVEDEGFWDHNGVNAQAIIRALIQNVSAGGIEQGGSTITQQLVKIGVIGDDKTLDRKIPEAALALRLENQMTKQEILEAYLNTVYFGAGAYGVRAGAEIYFGLGPDELDWGQSALLAGLIANPSAADPTRFPAMAEERRTYALQRLLDTGHITSEEFNDYRNSPLPEQRNVAAEWEPTNYFIEEVRRELLANTRLGDTPEERADTLFGGGLRVFTTYDPAAQEMAERAVADNLPFDERGFTIAMASVEPGTGYVRTLIGGPGFDEFEYNIATQKGRPTGSSFKPFVLAAAMENGYVPADELNGIGACVFPNPQGFPNPYRAVNFGGGTGSVATVRSQTLRSSNCAYLRLGQIVGLTNVAQTASALGIQAELDPGVISMPLGPYDITPIEMATAYGAFESDGVSYEPIFVLRVEDRDGSVLLENQPVGNRAVSAQSARLVTSILESNIRFGTGTRARLEEQPAAGKTGTAQDFGDAWFVGYTPYLATAVWMGNPDERIPMRDVEGVGSVVGGSVPARVWGQFNNEFHAGLPITEFERPDGTRAGRRIRTDIEQEEYEDVLQTPCGIDEAALDTDDDGEIDACEDVGGFEYDPGIGLCPALLEPRDVDNDGEFDICVVPTTTTTEPPETTTTTTTEPPDTTTTTVSE